MTQTSDSLLATRRRPLAARGFSLIELLLAVFILAIGIISISALFPAGIAQQQAANDEQLGPIVAEQALGTIRSRVRPEDFGSFEEFGIFDVLSQSTSDGSYVYRPAPGDWSWMRPAILAADAGATPQNDVGSVDIFSAASSSSPPIAELTEFPSGLTIAGSSGKLFGIPYSTARYGGAPGIVITQRERYWPAIPENQTITTPSPYVWDVMFRRFGGKIQVAIFVYRVVGTGGAPRAYVAKANPASSSQPPVPFRRVPVSVGSSPDAASTGNGTGLQVRTGWTQPNDTPFTTGLFTTNQGLAASDFPVGQLPQIQHTWQYPGQWLVDGNGNVHRVALGRRTSSDLVNATTGVRLSAPSPRVPQIQAYDDYELIGTTANDPVPQGIRTIFFVPAFDADRNQLIPVYATVREL
ncbi:MAG: prepilin-type N-terminal cleavage/methylation domain-containing protein [Phycisphaerales bacterium]